MNNKVRKIISTVFATFFVMSISVAQVGAVPISTKEIKTSVSIENTLLVLGDSISYGMSATKGNGYADLLYKHLKTSPDYSDIALDNLSVPGYTSRDLLTKLQTQTYIDAVKNAKVINVSIGGNNLLSPVIGAVCKALGVSPSSPNLISDLNAAVSSNPDKNAILANVEISSLLKSLQAGVTQFASDFPLIINTLKANSPQAKIYILNLYNPFTPTDMTYDMFDKYIKGINKIIEDSKTADNYKIADVYNKFKTTTGVVNFKVFSTPIQADPHPTTIGHAAIYQSILDVEGKVTKVAKRLAGNSRVDTALAIAKATYSGNVPNVILATAKDYPDALSGSVLAYKLNSPILLVGDSKEDQEKVLSYIMDNMDEEGKVYILGGYGAVNKDIETKITEIGFKNIIRLSGTNRYETAVKIADTIGIKENTPVVLVSGEGYADALSISSTAAVNQYPILLVNKNETPSLVKNQISSIKPSKVYIIGLQGSVSSDVENQVVQTGVVSKENIVRIGGADRFKTSLEVSKYFSLKGNIACVATGNDFPDALAGSLYAAKNNAPIILVSTNISDEIKSYLQNSKLTGASIFGGEGVVNKDIEQQINKIFE